MRWVSPNDMSKTLQFQRARVAFFKETATIKLIASPSRELSITTIGLAFKLCILNQSLLLTITKTSKKAFDVSWPFLNSMQNFER
jgi:hypothetical protein